MISSIRLDGTTACMHLPGAADTEAFVTYVAKFSARGCGAVTSW
jgi:hypothetical protein